MSLGLRGIVLVCLTTGVAAAEPAGASTRPRMSATRTMQPPRIDGQLDDVAWKGTPASDGFSQLFPAEGKPPTERTEVRVVYDDESIYVAVRMEDSEPGRIVARLTRRDRDIETDWVAVVVDSRHDRRTGYLFQLSAAGVQVDGIFYDDASQNLDWDAVWDGAVSRDERGWSAEMRIPLSVLRFPAADVQEWGFQVFRNISRRKETDAWSFKPSTAQGQVSWFGTLDGLQGLRPRRALELRPFVAARLATQASGAALFGAGGEAADATFRPDLGLDAKLNLGSDLILDATFNPDFGQVEADQVVLNLSRFEAFFPEKRPFFLEGSDVYQTPVQLFYSRRIGRPTGPGVGRTIVAAGGTPLTIVSAPSGLRIWSATKVTGAVTDRFSLGVLGAVTAAERVEAVDEAGASRTIELAPERSTAVARGRYSLGDGYLGFAATAANRLGGDVYRAQADHDAYTQGLDLFWNAGGTVRVWAQGVASQRAGGPAWQTPDGRACAEGTAGCTPIRRLQGSPIGPGSVGYGALARTQGQLGHLMFNVEGRAYSPLLDVNDAGFLQAYDQLWFKAISGYVESAPGATWQSYSLVPFAQVSSSFAGVPTTSFAGLHLDGQLRKSFTYLQMETGYFFPGTWDLFETMDGGRLEAPSFTDTNVYVSTDPRRDLVLSGLLDWGHSLTGLGDDGGVASLTLALQATPRLSLELSPELAYDGATLRFEACVDPAGAPCSADTDARSYRLHRLESAYVSLTTRGTYTFTPRLSFQWYAQLFLASGDARDPVEVSTSGLHPDLRTADMVPATGEATGDFQEVALNVNAVLRWEMRPGSSLYAVYTRAEAGYPDVSGRRPRLGLEGFSTGPTEDVVMVKLAYFVR